MLTLMELGTRHCRYPITPGPPHFFCGDPKREGSSYCAKHHDVCHIGPGKPWQALAGMMEAVETTVIATPRNAADVQPPIDEALRSRRIDKPLMERI